MKLSTPIPLVKAGDQPSASHQNRIIRQVQSNSTALGVSTQSPNLGRTTIQAQNISGVDLEIGQVVAFKRLVSETDATKIDPRDGVSDAIFEFDKLVYETGETSNLGNLAVVLDDCPDDDIARLAIGGQVVVHLQGSHPTGASFRFAWPDPDPTNYGRWILNEVGGFRVLDQINAEYALVDLGSVQRRLLYKLTQASQAPDPTTAKLLHYNLTVMSDTEIEIADPLSTASDDVTDYIGWCEWHGDRLIVNESPCS